MRGWNFDRIKWGGGGGVKRVVVVKVIGPTDSVGTSVTHDWYHFHLQSKFTSYISKV